MKTPSLTLLALIASGLLAASAVGATAQDGDAATSPSLITEVVRPGVEIVLGDEADHDLTERHPEHHRDMDLLAIGPDGTVWIASSARFADKAFLDGQEVWALGRPGMTSIEGQDLDALLVRADGTPTALVEGDIFELEGDTWVADPEMGTRQFETLEGTVWLIEQDDPAGDDIDVPYEGFGVLVALWDGETWSTPDEWGQAIDDADAGQWRIDPEGGIDGRVDGVGFGLLEGTFINMIALAPDGMVWAIGGIGDESGGVYRIDPELASQPAPDDDTSIA